MECIVIDHGCDKDKQTTLLENIMEDVAQSEKNQHM